MIPDYCGFGDWPECADLAATGGDGGLLMVVAMFGAVMLLIGVAGLIRRWVR